MEKGDAPMKMPATKEIIVGVALLVIFAVAMVLVLNVYRNEGEQRSAAISEEGEKDPNHIEVFVKLLAVDPVKGDVSARLEFAPNGSYEKGEGVLARPLKLYVNSATGKQEHEFPKDKRMNPVDVTVSLYDGLVTDYPFDKHKGFLEMYFTDASTKPSSAQGADKAGSSSSGASAAPSNPSEATASAASPTPAASPAQEGAASNKAADTDEASEDVSLSVDFYGSIPA
jgi:hypothetical protein